ncbi:hypothetical protein HYX17_03315 [Candidatus Woesearchaeota archaeon]|nr:hypothetical protein [Candidatus Woesearchaeota archaeon]
MESYNGLRITSKPEDKDRKIGVGQYEFQKSSTALPSPLGNVEVGALGSGISYYRDGKYLGYHILPDHIFGLPLEEIVETAEFKSILRKIKSGKI